MKQLNLKTETLLTLSEMLHVTNTLTSVNSLTLLNLNEGLHLTDAFVAVAKQLTSVLNWPSPAAIAYGTVLDATQLNANSSTVGGFTYTSATGYLPATGTQKLSVLFSPTNKTEYTTATAKVALIVNKALSSLTCLALAAQPVLVTYHAASSIPISVAGLFAGAGIASPTGSIHYTIGADAAPSATIAAGKASVAIPNTQATGLYSGDVT